MSNFEKVAASPEMLGAFLASLHVAAGPWGESFHRTFCDSCERENCDVDHCPHQDTRNNPTWWLTQAETGEERKRIVMWVKGYDYRKAMEELAGKIKEARSERIKETGDKSFTHLEALLTGLVEVLLPGKKCQVVMNYDPDAEEVTFSQLSAHGIQAGR